jgi:hypothetical protein
MNIVYHVMLLRVQVKWSTSRERIEEHSPGPSWRQAQELYVTDVRICAALHTYEIGPGLLFNGF